MSTIHREGGFSFKVYSNDHQPPHVHVWYSGKRALINVGGGEIGPSLRRNHDMRAPDLHVALQIVKRNQQKFLEKWKEIHAA